MNPREYHQARNEKIREMRKTHSITWIANSFGIEKHLVKKILHESVKEKKPGLNATKSLKVNGLDWQ